MYLISLKSGMLMILTFLSLPTDDQLGHSNSDSDGGVGPPQCTLQSGCQGRLQYANHNTQIEISRWFSKQNFQVMRGILALNPLNASFCDAATLLPFASNFGSNTGDVSYICQKES